ncbi:MAG: DUF1566 domain-containing protein [bacterium]|nr:DUF1566 domain-containing protein [bacterium]
MKKNRSILVITMISFFTVTMIFFLGLNEVAGGKPKKPDPPEPIMIMLDEIYDIVLDTNTKVTPATCTDAPVAKTGQTESYAAGDDGDLEKGMAWPNPRFTDNSDGTVTDNLTNLIWMINANYFEMTNWESACNACISLADDGVEITDGSQPGDWRLPNIRELLSLIDYAKVSTALPAGHPFINVQGRTYWSSTMSYGGPRAWVVDIAYGHTSRLQTWEIYNITWCVRGGQ